MVGNTVRRVPMATVHIESPYLTGEVSALCPPDAVYDVIVGNVSGARAADDPNPEWHMANVVTTRSSAKRVGDATPLNVRLVENWLEINRDKIVKMQGEDVSLQKYYEKTDIKKKGLQEVKFEVKDRVLCRVFKHSHVKNGKPVLQVMVPEQLRRQVMKLAHDSIMGGHLGIRKTVDRILNNFYWPAIHTDVSRFCRSCDICQRTIRKESISRAPLQNMPLIAQLFKRVAVDLIGPIHPTSEEGNRYILTLAHEVP